MAKFNKKRARELQHDKFRDTAITVFDRLGDRLEGKGRAIIYGIIGVIALALVLGLALRWRHRKADEAQRALGRAITIASTPLASDPSAAADPAAPKFSSEQERAQRSIDEFQKVAAKYGDPYQTEARYFMATNLLAIDRAKGIAELAEIAKSSNVETSQLAKFALAQAYEMDSKFDDAAKLYIELAAQKATVVTADTANLRLAEIYEKQGKKTEAADLLFSMVDASRKAKDADGTALQTSGAVRDATEKLQKLDPDRYAKLTPESSAGDLPF